MNAPSVPRLPNLDLDLLATLVAIADTGSFSAAADVVLRTPSAVSMQVKRMEDIVGRTLFVRDSRSVTLTPEGAFLVEHARRMLALNRTALSRFLQPDVQGMLRLGAPDDVSERFLPRMLRRFADECPAVTVNVVVDESDRLLEMYRNGEIELGIMTCGAGFDDSEARVIYEERVTWAMRRGGISIEQTPLPVSVWEEFCTWRQAGIEGLDEQGRDWRIAFQSGNISGQRAAILADVAIASVPVSVLSDQIVEVPGRHNLPELPNYGLGLLYGRHRSTIVDLAAQSIEMCFRSTTPAA